MNQTTEAIPVIPIVTGEVFLQDTVTDEQHCYICKKEFNKFEDKEMLLLRTGKNKMGFCCPTHRGVVQEFMRQFKHIPGGWEKYDTKDNDTNNSGDNVERNSNSSRQKVKTKKRNNKPSNGLGRAS
jgi:hypothetical protein